MVYKIKDDTRMTVPEVAKTLQEARILACERLNGLEGHASYIFKENGCRDMITSGYIGTLDKNGKLVVKVEYVCEEELPNGKKRYFHINPNTGMKMDGRNFTTYLKYIDGYQNRTTERIKRRYFW